jgi:RPA family protein
MSTAEYQKAWRAKHGARTGVIGRPRTYEGCGSPAAYSRHIRKGEPVDDSCRDAWRTYQNDRRKARAKAAEEAAREERAKKDAKNAKVRAARAAKKAKTTPATVEGVVEATEVKPARPRAKVTRKGAAT